VTGTVGGPPRIRLDGDLDDGVLKSALRDHLCPVLAGDLPRHRWFGDKDRAIREVVVADAGVVRSGEDWYVLALLDVRFGDGNAEYFVPLCLTSATGTNLSATIATFETGSGEYQVEDALTLPAFRAWLMDRLVNGAEMNTAAGTFRWWRSAVLDRFVGLARSGASRMLDAEQSNSAIIFGDALILKCFRKIRPGINPEEEVGRFLTARTSFRRVPLVVGGWTYVPRDTSPVRSLALVQDFVESVGDGWTYVLRSLSTWTVAPGSGAAWSAAGRPHRVAPTGDAPVEDQESRVPSAMEDLRRLGERTGELHAALASDRFDPDFAPESATRADVEGWRGSLLRRLDETGAVLRAQRTAVPTDVRHRCDEFAGRVGELARRGDGFRGLVGTAKIRVHGDYHLGQTLRTPDDDWVILDFEGEPARPMAERRAKTSPLKDVAGMLRSFGYARGAALRAGHPSAADEHELDTWETSARSAFLSGYRAATVDQGGAFLPTETSAIAAALDAWELDKALYDVHYELNNRPDWLALSLAAILSTRGTT